MAGENLKGIIKLLEGVKKKNWPLALIEFMHIIVLVGIFILLMFLI